MLTLLQATDSQARYLSYQSLTGQVCELLTAPLQALTGQVCELQPAPSGHRPGMYQHHHYRPGQICILAQLQSTTTVTQARYLSYKAPLQDTASQTTTKDTGNVSYRPPRPEAFCLTLTSSLVSLLGFSWLVPYTLFLLVRVFSCKGRKHAWPQRRENYGR